MSIEVKGLTKIYGTQKALDEVSFEVHKGEILGFLGPNGAGKSTTMKILTGFIPQNYGIAKVCGIDTREQLLEIRKKIGYLPESNPLYYDMYVKEYLEFVGRLFPDKKVTSARIKETILLTGLEREQNKTIGLLSKGYKQRVGLAQAILHNPEVLILDEPTSGLDPNQLIEIRSLIKQLGKEKTVIFSSHIMQEVEAIADRVVIINQGKLVANDNIHNLQSGSTNVQLLTITLKNKINIGSLKQIEGVHDVVSLSENCWQLRSGSDIRENVFVAAVTNGWIILEMNREEQRLEDVFKKLTK